jgi:hypothetical protein
MISPVNTYIMMDWRSKIVVSKNMTLKIEIVFLTNAYHHWSLES